MPTSAEPRLRLVDTSVAVPLLTGDHPHHDAVFEAVGAQRLGLSGHAAFETFSVLTRMPPPARKTSATVARLLALNFPETRSLGAEAAGALLGQLGRRGLAGGSVYDALVAAAAVEHGARLVSRDRRALPTYREMGVDLSLLD